MEYTYQFTYPKQLKSDVHVKSLKPVSARSPLTKFERKKRWKNERREREKKKNGFTITCVLCDGLENFFWTYFFLLSFLLFSIPSTNRQTNKSQSNHFWFSCFPEVKKKRKGIQAYTHTYTVYAAFFFLIYIRCVCFT